MRKKNETSHKSIKKIEKGNKDKKNDDQNVTKPNFFRQYRAMKIKIYEVTQYTFTTKLNSNRTDFYILKPFVSSYVTKIFFLYRVVFKKKIKYVWEDFVQFKKN